MYYLRDRKGKSARISEKIKKRIGIDISEQTPEGEVIKENPKEVEAKAEPKKEETKKENHIKNKEVLKSEPKKVKIKEEKK